MVYELTTKNVPAKNGSSAQINWGLEFHSTGGIITSPLILIRSVIHHDIEYTSPHYDIKLKVLNLSFTNGVADKVISPKLVNVNEKFKTIEIEF